MNENKKLYIVLGVVALIVIIFVISLNGNKPSYEGEPMINLTYSQYEEKLNSDKNELVAVVQTGCGYCDMAKEEFEKVYADTGFQVPLLNITDLSSDERTKFLASLTYLSEENWGTPLLLVVKNGELVDTHNGYTSAANYIDFFKNNGLIGD